MTTQVIIDSKTGQPISLNYRLQTTITLRERGYNWSQIGRVFGDTPRVMHTYMVKNKLQNYCKSRLYGKVDVEALRKEFGIIVKNA